MVHRMHEFECLLCVGDSWVRRVLRVLMVDRARSLSKNWIDYSEFPQDRADEGREGGSEGGREGGRGGRGGGGRER